MTLLRRAALAATVAGLALGAQPAAAQAPSCTHTIGAVLELTGPAGRFGQAASKSVELALNGLNEAAGRRASRAAASLSTCATASPRARSRWTRRGSSWTCGACRRSSEASSPPSRSRS
jgi:hypothetical protein